jgi:hypothetical protein
MEECKGSETDNGLGSGDRGEAQPLSFSVNSAIKTIVGLAIIVDDEWDFTEALAAHPNAETYAISVTYKDQFKTFKTLQDFRKVLGFKE